MKTVIETPAERAAMLPEPNADKAVTIPIELWPDYLRLHALEPVRSTGWGADWKLVCTVEKGQDDDRA
jgi:hypothetical protein